MRILIPEILLKSKILTFFKSYPRFGFALVASLEALILDIIGIGVPVARTAAHWILIAEALIMAALLAKDMYDDVRGGKYGIDILAVTAIVTAVLLGEYWTAIITVIMLTGGEALEDYAESRAKSELTALLNRAPTLAHVLTDGQMTDTPVSDVNIDDMIVIRPGEVVPVDAVITEGSTSADESSLTGESLPVGKQPGAYLMSGSINLDGSITAKVTQTAENSQYQQIITLVKSASDGQSPFVKLADRYAVPFTIFAYVVGVGVWIATGDPGRFLRVLVVATPCPLLLGAPIGLISGMSRAAKHGVIVKSGSALEKLAQLKSFAFDKTGTLTHGTPKLHGVFTIGSHKEDAVLSAAAALEHHSNHILAQVITNEAKHRKLTIPSAEDIEETPGLGLSGTVKGKTTLVGKAQFMTSHNVPLPSNIQELDRTATLVAVEKELVGIITFEDTVRDESAETIRRLQASGIKHVMMLTGDNAATASSIAKKVGIADADVTSDCLPADKVAAIRSLPAHHRPVAMVGDGVNDAPVLTAADVGIALGARGSTAASESADVVILLDDITKVAEAREIAKRTFYITKQSILLGIGLSVILMGIFATGIFKPVIGAAVQEVVDVVVILNALRAHIDRK